MLALEAETVPLDADGVDREVHPSQLHFPSPEQPQVGGW